VLPFTSLGRISIVDTYPFYGTDMVTTIQRWGNSLAVRIPKAFASQAQIQENTEIEISLEGNRIVIAPARHEWNLDKLVRGITPSNVHREVEWGESVGRETF
jgi:antitoxin MazE